MEDALSSFAVEVEHFCSWCESTPAAPDSEARNAIAYLSRLYLLAQGLRGSVDAPDLEGTRLSDDEWRRAYQRFGSLPFGFYHVTLEPHDVGADSPECALGDVADDLADIYRDLKEGLSLFRAGHRASAEWEWTDSFRIHWGQHAVDALRVLHLWCAEHRVD